MALWPGSSRLVSVMLGLHSSIGQHLFTCRKKKELIVSNAAFYEGRKKTSLKPWKGQLKHLPLVRVWLFISFFLLEDHSVWSASIFFIREIGRLGENHDVSDCRNTVSLGLIADSLEEILLCTAWCNSVWNKFMLPFETIRKCWWQEFNASICLWHTFNNFFPTSRK